MPSQPSDRARGRTRVRLAVVAVLVAAGAIVAAGGVRPAQATAADEVDGSVEVGRLIEPVRRLVASRVAVADAATSVMARAATPEPPSAPPTACPVPAAEFVDSWGAPRSGGRSHKGVDMMAPYGSPVYAPVAGTVRPSNHALGGLAFYLVDADGTEYYGSHLATLEVRSGWVEAGTLLGTVGTTGNASTPHLHLSVDLAGVGAVNPFPYAVDWCAAPVPTPIAFPT